jgi:hypothetical protein
VLALALVVTSCGSPTANPSTTSSATTPPPVTTLVTATTVVTTTTTSTTTVPYRELAIHGTGKVYTLEESQAFGEFGPLLWNLVTTLNGTDRIEHHPGYEWVSWGPTWGGRIYDAGGNTYGVTDLDAVDPEAVAAAVPAGETIVLREVPWSLDELNEFSDRLREIARGMDTQNCGISWGVRPGEGLHIDGTADQAYEIASQWALNGLPPQALHFEPPACHQFWSEPVLVPMVPPTEGTFGELDCAPGTVSRIDVPGNGVDPEDLARGAEPGVVRVESDPPSFWWGYDSDGVVIAAVALNDITPATYTVFTCSPQAP